MTIKEIRKMSIDEMNKKYVSLKKELFDARIQLNLVKLKDTSRIRKIKKIIRQIKTIIREEEISKIKNLNKNIKLKNDSVLDKDTEKDIQNDTSLEKN
ncbi:50S ribosomal protein L29 [Columbia Basin potato purple top phytoplasma]|uniref:Large ribosomal subunit protein uL29 n=1 Tax=Columbia Basin potato purple top phytoplasma TaxID=307134 RepID=A0ABT5L8W1_9MOLU|nr:50S ribosomal protein L29 [Columbia Basin potato purple top phytoplasma]MDC9031977.1 ribosomal protein L29 [Columbia Basin potato purple top phytoplasma]